MVKVAFLGLGVMGYPMAGHLKTRGYEVYVYNRTTSKAQSWVQDFQGTLAPTPAEAVRGADFVFCCVGNDDDLRAVTLGADGAFAHMKSGAIFIDHTTASADVARELYTQAKTFKIGFLDAPVSGGQMGAQKGQLSVMVGGDREDYERAEPLMACFAKCVQLMGPSGSGQLTKMVNQICIAGLVQALSEGVAFAQKAGLNVHDVISVISKGAAQSWQMENRFATMSENKFDFGFAVDWMRKDLGICMKEAEKNGAQLPVTSMVDQFYSDVQNMGGGRWDTSSLIKRLT